MEPHETANDRFKRGFGTAFWLGLVAATALHVAVILAMPEFAVATPTDMDDAVIHLSSAEPRIPPPPPEIPRPARPVISTNPMIDDLTTIDPTMLNGEGPARLAPPAPGGGTDEERMTAFTTYQIRPKLTNPDAVARALREQYPSALRDAGIGGVAGVWFFIDERGVVRETRLDESSGYDSLDAAALEVADRMRFTPAYNRDRPVPVWVSFEIRFEVQGPRLL